MLKRFLKDSMLYGLARIVASAIGFVLLPFYARLLVPSDFGTVDLLLLLTSLVNIAGSLQITQAVGRFYPAAGTEIEKREVASTALWFTIVAYFGVVSLGFAGARWLGPWLLGGSERTPVFMAGGVATGTSGLLHFLLNQLRWSLKPKHFAAATVAQAIVSAAVAFSLVVIHRFGVIGIVAGQIVGNLCALGAAIWWAKDCFGWLFRTDKLREMLAYSLPLVPSSLGVFVAIWVDRIAIKEMMTIDDLGRYGIAYRIASVATLITAGVQGAWMPMVYSRYREQSAPAEMARVFRYFVVVALALLLGLAAFAPELVELVATRQYASISGLIPITGAATILGGMYIFAPGLAIAKKTKAIAGINIAAGLVNTLLNVMLIPILGLYGAGLATLAGACTQFTLYYASGQKVYPIPHDGKRLGSAVASTLCLAVIWRVCDSPDGSMSVAVLSAKAGMYAVAVGTIAVWVIGWRELGRLGSSIGRFFRRRAPVPYRRG